MALLCALAVSLGGAATHGAEVSRDFTRYQIILDRSPFGPIAGTVDVPQPGFSTRFTFIGIVKLDDTQPFLAVIIDKEGNRTYFKAEGETVGTATVVKIEKPDRAPAKLVLKQGLEVATLTMDTKASVGAAPPASQPQPSMPGQPQIPVPLQPGVRRIPFRRGG